MSSTMADKLERLFGKFGRDAQSSSRPSSPAYTNTASLFARKGSLTPAPPTTSSSSHSHNYSSKPIMSLEDMSFPQPSFIRPKVAKMVPREDRTASMLGVQRPPTAGRSMSVPGPGPSPSLPQGATASGGGATAAATAATTAAATAAAPGSLRVVAPAHSARNLSSKNTSTKNTNPPVAFNLNSFDSRRSSFNTNNSSATLSSGCSTISSCNSSTAGGGGGRHSFVDAFPEITETNLSLNNQRLPRRSSSLLQRRELSLAPLAAFDDFAMGQPGQQKQTASKNNTAQRDSVTITINSGEVSPATVLAPVNDDNNNSKNDNRAASVLAPSKTIKGAPQPEIKIVGDDDLALTAVTPPAAAETPLLRDSICAPPSLGQPLGQPSAISIALPQSRPTSPAAEPSRRRGRLSRRPMSLRYKRHLPNEPTPSSPSSVLMEPNLGDFLSLSDDDIAEDAEDVAKNLRFVKSQRSLKSLRLLRNKPLPPSPSPATTSPTPATTSSPTPATTTTTTSPPATSPTRRRVDHAPSQPPSFRAPSPSGFAPYSPSYLALLPGMPATAGGRPRTPAGDSRMAAAFKIAGIASRYQFDLAYIATIWPKNMAYLKSSAVSVASAAAVQSIGWPSSPSAPPAMKLVSRTSSQTSRVPSNRASHVSHVSNKSQKSQKSHKGHASHKSHASQKSFSSTSTNAYAYAPVAPRQSKLDAQFLAAFGLATVKTPYTLSASMHHKILNNAEQQWTTFGTHDSTYAGRKGMPHEFAQSFGCAFHHGHAPVMTTFSQQRYERRPSTADDCDADTEQDFGRGAGPQRRKNSTASSLSAVSNVSNVSTVSVSQGNNRGIVFVAYRRKEVADERAARGDKDDFEALYRDVEALVQEIHDAHVQQVQAEAHRPRPEAEDIVAASLSSLAPSSTYNRQSRFLTVRAVS